MQRCQYLSFSYVIAVQMAKENYAINFIEIKKTLIRNGGVSE